MVIIILLLNKKIFKKLMIKKNIYLVLKKNYSFKTSLIGNIQIKNLIFAIVAAYLSKLKIERYFRI